ncbi:hypothetical protein O0555_21670 [Brevibacillus laterosporus]|uniref:HK97 family phage prohead protease n=1 Tax=Brevibacillus laterosporus TaxID=1465 RepID=UPI0018CFE182|nr:hypothetical protein [Brevibacillus laterosporus]MBG9797122.1 hypothetical protein [Brevibacillus laterosporus]MCR8939914.1 hypothetical protein [Brevibacillus laterosporus]MCZ0842554.1 hypothetical protein [Brevibacillus laterosporus]MCZ0847562.1 hypothetical protein [Brevibacillus laterosporus]MED1909576.1 hypothetical protein [Brevibacillus laterosporus]
MEQIFRKNMGKLADVTEKSVSDDDLAIINTMTRREFSLDEIYVFPILCCHTRLDRDFDRFSVDALQEMTELAKGVTVIFDHIWSAAGQTARIYKANVRQESDGEYGLLAWAYMPKNEKTQPIIDDIDAGILKEVSVGFRHKQLQCSACKQDYLGGDCPHLRGREVDGHTVFTWITGVKEWYEVSFVAVPAQPGAGVEKSYSKQVDEEKQKQIGGNQVEKLIEYLKSLGVEVKDDEHALSIVQEWREKKDGADKLEKTLKEKEEELKGVKEDLKTAKQDLEKSPDANMAAVGQKFFEETRNEILKMGGMLEESTKALEIVVKGVTSIDTLLELKKEYQERIDKKFPPVPQSKTYNDEKAPTDVDDLKQYSI